jgi:hypothetical protein
LTNTTVYELLHCAPKLDISACSFTTAQCQNRDNIWKLKSAYVFPPYDREGKPEKYFPFKPAAIISATFAEVLFLDSDAYLVRDPEYLFQYDPMYRQFGALFFPDSHMTRQHVTIWKFLNATCPPNEPEFDSGVILVDKRRVWNALYITKLMNDRSDIFYGWVKKNCLQKKRQSTHAFCF